MPRLTKQLTPGIDRQIELHPGPQSDFWASPADIGIYGGGAGGGKTYALLVDSIPFLVNVPGFNAMLFRRTYPEITQPGGMWDESSALFGGWCVPNQSALSWTFPPHGNVLKFGHLQHEVDMYQYQGAQLAYIGFDQLELFTANQFWFMQSRNRSLCSVPPYIRATCNPDNTSWVKRFIQWWIAEDGYADMSRAGKMRWFVRDGDEVVWADDSAALPADKMPRSVTFIPSTIHDNPTLMSKDPAYIGNLLSLPSYERNRLLGDAVRGGNWNVRAGMCMFKREWFRIQADPPAKFDHVCRFWDMASTEQSKKARDPDYTVGLKLGYVAGLWPVLDVVRGRWSPHVCEQMVRQTAVLDGPSVAVRMEQEAGASGKAMIAHYAANVLAGFDFKGVSPTGSKELRAQPFSAAAEAGNVVLISAPWNAAFLDELEAFSPDCPHDDEVDSASGAMSCIRERVHIMPPLLTSHLTNKAVLAYDSQISELRKGLSPAGQIEADRILGEMAHAT